MFLGGGLGAAIRHAINFALLSRWNLGLPAATILVNVTGSFLIGLAAGLFAAFPGTSQSFRLFLTTGLLGGFTTFSAFSLDALTLWHRGDHGLWLAYVGGSVALSLIAAALGLIVSRGFA